MVASMNRFGHIDLRVADLAAAVAFYEQLMPALGFTERYHGEDWKVWATTDPLPSTAYFAITQEPTHVANSNRIAFWVDTATDVDLVAEVARQAGAAELSGPKLMPYGPGYYGRSSRTRPAIGLRSTSGPSSSGKSEDRCLGQCSWMTPGRSSR